MIIIIPTIKYGSTYYNTFTMGVCSNYHGYFFQCTQAYWKPNACAVCLIAETYLWSIQLTAFSKYYEFSMMSSFETLFECCTSAFVIDLKSIIKASSNF